MRLPVTSPTSRTLPSRSFLRTSGKTAAVLAAVALALSGCATGPATPGAVGGASPSQSSAFPVTIKHVFGETTIGSQPQRVVTVSWVNDDVAIALGVVPVGLPRNAWGGNEQGSTPWKDAALEALGAGFGSDKAPVQFSEADGINFTEIAKLNPDVILGAYSGLTDEDYKKLSEIAPVVAQPEVAYGTSWQDSTAIIGQALGKEAEAEKLVEDTEATITEKVSKYPQLAGKSYIYGNLDPAATEKIGLYTANDNRPRFLNSLGMKLAPVVEENSKGSSEFYIPWSAEKADELESDIFVTWVADAAAARAVQADPLMAQIPAVKNGALVADSDNTLTLSISASSPLSLPWSLDTFLPQLASAADKTAK
jgi:iron complex transport system substrate-binding protein